MEARGTDRPSAASRQLMLGLAVVIAIVVVVATVRLGTAQDDGVALEAVTPTMTDSPGEAAPSLAEQQTDAPGQAALPGPDPDPDQPIPPVEPGDVGPDPAQSGDPDVAGDADPAADPAPQAPAPPPATDSQQPSPPDPQVPADPAAPAAPADPAAPAVPPADDPAEDTAPPGGEPTLPVGTCLSGIQIPTTVTSVTPSPCDQPHAGEVFVSEVLPLAAGAAYPGEQALDDQTRLLCQGAAFTAYVGIDFRATTFLVQPLFPTAESWGAGDRNTACYLFDSSGPRTASARGSGL